MFNPLRRVDAVDVGQLTRRSDHGVDLGSTLWGADLSHLVCVDEQSLDLRALRRDVDGLGRHTFLRESKVARRLTGRHTEVAPQLVDDLSVGLRGQKQFHRALDSAAGDRSFPSHSMRARDVR